MVDSFALAVKNALMIERVYAAMMGACDLVSRVCCMQK
jgi:hypothetical protein